jgi:hypothetical protein
VDEIGGRAQLGALERRGRTGATRDLRQRIHHRESGVLELGAPGAVRVLRVGLTLIAQGEQVGQITRVVEPLTATRRHLEQVFDYPTDDR